MLLHLFFTNKLSLFFWLCKKIALKMIVLNIKKLFILIFFIKVMDLYLTSETI